MASWTPAENKHFEQILAVYDKDTPDRWQNIARAVGKSIDDVRRQYRLLEEDVRRIESANFSFGSRGYSLDDEQRLRYHRL